MADNDNRDLMWIYQFEQPQQCCNRCIEGTHRYVLGAFKKYPPDVIGALKKYPPARDKVLICIGLNPNDGIPGRLEDTVQAINDFAFDDKRKNKKIKDEKLPQWPLDGWTMLNLSPIRCGNSKSLSSKINKDKIYEIAHERNIEIIKSILETYPDAVRLAAWGDDIIEKDKDYLRETFYEFTTKEEKKRKWYCCDLPSDRENKPKELKKLENIEAGLTGEGNPRHPWKRGGQSWGKQPNEAVLHKFEISSYLTKLKKKEEKKKKEKKNM